MLDLYNRHINYLRISVIDRCNLRCTYCMPESGVPLLRRADIITFEEIVQVIKEAVGLGINKIRLTGGEPLVRKGICDLVAMISAIEGIKDLAMTTNGILLDKYARSLASAGLKRVNISLDTLNPDGYKSLTRGGSIDDVLRGIEAAKEAGLKPVKINCVLGHSSGMGEREDMQEFCRKHDLELRFIRQMDLETGSFHPIEGSGGGKCSICNRIRLTANGLVKPCLFNDAGYNIRELGISKAIKMAVLNKPLNGTYSKANQFYNIGG